MWDKLLKLLGFRKRYKIEIVPGVSALEFYRALKKEYSTMTYKVGFCEALSKVCKKNSKFGHIPLRKCKLLVEEFAEYYPDEFYDWGLGSTVFWFTEPEGWDYRMELIQGVIDKLEKEEGCA